MVVLAREAAVLVRAAAERRLAGNGAEPPFCRVPPALIGL
jgi:hypothetical protein